jgi:hypothetical protein
MGCSSCKKNKIKIGGNNVSIDNSEKSVGVKVLIFLTKGVLFLIASVIMSLIVIPFSIYMLAKVFFFDGSVDVESLIVGANNFFKDRKEKREDKKNEINLEDGEEYEYEYTDVDEIKEE